MDCVFAARVRRQEWCLPPAIVFRSICFQSPRSIPARICSGVQPFARHLIRVIAFFGAGSAFGAMQVFKTTAQAGVADGPVAAAVAGQLIQDTGNLGRILIDLHLPGQLKIDAGQLLAVQNRWQLCVCWRWRRVECRKIDGRIGPFGMAGNADKCDDKGQPNTATHRSSIPLRAFPKLYDSFVEKPKFPSARRSGKPHPIKWRRWAPVLRSVRNIRAKNSPARVTTVTHGTCCGEARYILSP